MPAVAIGGASISYARTGSGPAVLLLQGVGLVGNGWRPQIDALARRFTVVAVDNRGIGASTRGDGALTIETMADDAIEVMDAEGIQRFHLAGHSMGGLIAQQIALTAPARVMSLGFLCTFLRGAQGARLTPSMMMTAIRMRVGSRAMRRNAFMELVMPDEYLKTVDRARLAEDLRPLFGHDLAEQPPIVMKQLRAMSRFDVSSRLHELAPIPTLVMSAVHDRIAIPAYGRALADAIPGAKYVRWLAAGHGVTIQCADGVNEVLTRHFDEAAAQPRGAAPAS